MKRSPLARGSWIPVLAVATAIAGALGITSVVARSASAAPACTYRAGSRSEWTYSWRPGWLPGDPMPSESAGLPGGGAIPGLWVTLDPVTRRPTAPTAEQRRAAQAALAPVAPEMDQALPVERIPGGGELIHLNGRHLVFSIARRDASGRFTTSCASDSAASSAPPAPVRPWEEK